MPMPISRSRPTFCRETRRLKSRISSEKDSSERSLPKKESPSPEKKKKKIKSGSKEPVWKIPLKLVHNNNLGSLINQSVRVRNKDIRQFLDGIYVSDKRLPI